MDSILSAISFLARSVSIPGTGEHMIFCVLCPLNLGTTGSSHFTLTPGLICFRGVVWRVDCTRAPLSRVPVFSFIRFSSVRALVISGIIWNRGTFSRLSTWLPSSSVHFT